MECGKRAHAPYHTLRAHTISPSHKSFEFIEAAKSHQCISKSLYSLRQYCDRLQQSQQRTEWCARAGTWLHGLLYLNTYVDCKTVKVSENCFFLHNFEELDYAHLVGNEDKRKSNGLVRTRFGRDRDRLIRSSLWPHSMSACKITDTSFALNYFVSRELITWELNRRLSSYLCPAVFVTQYYWTFLNLHCTRCECWPCILNTLIV